MKEIWVATQNARKFNQVSQYQINWGSVFFISVLLMVISCAKSDDLETLENDSPVDINTSVDNVSAVDINTPVDPVNDSNIIYTDIEPDYISINDATVYNLDLNNDGIVDFYLRSQLYYSRLWVAPKSNTGSHGVNALVVETGDWEPFIVPLNKDEGISVPENLYYYDTNGGELGFFYCPNSWVGKTNAYLGLRFNINGQTHYGWARLDVISGTQWAIKDYAYNTEPNGSIVAGQKD